MIIPCYNTAGYVVETLESVFSQTYKDYEVVVVNDGSPDTPSQELAIAPWRDKITYIKTENHGLAGARNNGIRASSGERVALLDLMMSGNQITLKCRSANSTRTPPLISFTRAH